MIKQKIEVKEENEKKENTPNKESKIKQKKSYKVKIGCQIIITLTILICACFAIKEHIADSTKTITLTQLSPNTNSQMMGYVIKTKRNNLIIIDGGTRGDAKQLKEIIGEYGNNVEAWIFTHPHIDHVGAFVEIVSNENDLAKINIKNIYYSFNSMEWYRKYCTRGDDEINFIDEVYNTINTKYNESAKPVNVGDKIEIDGIKIDILGAANPELTVNSVNNSSLVFKMNFGKKSMIFLGDTGSESATKICNEYSKEELKADMLQVSHHGQKGGSEELYKRISPEICFWPNTVWLEVDSNGYNDKLYDTEITNDWIEKIGVKQNYYAADGIISINID